MIKDICKFTVPIDKLPVWAFNIYELKTNKYLMEEKLPYGVKNNYYFYNPYDIKDDKYPTVVLLDYVNVCITDSEDNLEPYGFYKIKIDKYTKDITWERLSCKTCNCYPPSNNCGECPIWLSDSEEYYE